MSSLLFSAAHSGIQTVSRAINNRKGQNFSMFTPSSRNLNRVGLTGGTDPEKLIKSFRSYVFTCIDIRAKTVAANVKFNVVRLKSNGETERMDATHPLHQMLRFPNPYMTRYMLWYYTIAYLDTIGKAFWWIARNKMGKPAALWILPSQLVRVNAGDTKKGEQIIKSYTVRWDVDNEQEIPAEDVVHLRHPELSNPYYDGGSLIMRAAYEIDILQYIAEYHREFFSNDAMPALLLMFKQVMDDETRRRFEQQWIEKFNRKPGQVGYTEGEVTAQMLTESKELSYLDSIGINKSTIRGVFGVTPTMTMDIEHIQAQATLEAENYVFHKNTIEPLLIMLDEQITIDLAMPVFDKTLQVQHDSTVPRNLESESKLDTEALNSGWTSIDEVRVKRGMEPLNIPGSIEPLITSAKIPLSMITMSQQADGQTAKTKAMLTKLNLTEEEKASHWKAHDAFRMRHEVRAARQIKKWHRDIQADVVAKIRKHRKDAEQRAGAEGVNFNIEEWLKKLETLIGVEATRTMQAGFEQFISQHEINGVLWSESDPRVASAITSLNRKTVSIPQTLHADLNNVLQEAISQELPVDEIVKRVSKFFDNQIDYRSVRIARTVTNFAVNQGNLIAAKDSNIGDKKIWITQRDDLVRDLHANMDGEKIDLLKKFHFENGDNLEVPSDPVGKPENVINCRCTLYFVNDEGKSAQEEQKQEKAAQPIVVNIHQAPVNVTSPEIKVHPSDVNVNIEPAPVNIDIKQPDITVNIPKQGGSYSIERDDAGQMTAVRKEE